MKLCTVAGIVDEMTRQKIISLDSSRMRSRRRLSRPFSMSATYSLMTKAPDRFRFQPIASEDRDLANEL